MSSHQEPNHHKEEFQVGNDSSLRELAWLARYFMTHGREDFAQEILDQLSKTTGTREEDSRAAVEAITLDLKTETQLQEENR